jgi:hypothetical protein
VIDLRADGLINDVEQQVAAHLELGFCEINGRQLGHVPLTAKM